ncbi:hypothetical protein TL16_g01799 [Triparma laevis f. inornata]|uniref:PPIase cyclophilin-type domain-containing protein n=2 Tax=Triparma laevis TaxID=1534972 RepID=A0A9W7ALC0_9STRA|nr:hypothetical protein TL16_g01799 [Triparma laevis f. inornata]GMH74382.1 hypothetical protein TrLO_g3216 [Triparma laevis f. longispina]
MKATVLTTLLLLTLFLVMTIASDLVSPSTSSPLSVDSSNNNNKRNDDDVIEAAMRDSSPDEYGEEEEEDSDLSEFYVKFTVESMTGDKDGLIEEFVVKVIPSWAPRSAERFYDLVTRKFYDNTRFFWHLNSDDDMQGHRTHFGLKKGKAQKKWDKRSIPSEPLGIMSNLRTTLAFYFNPQQKERTKEGWRFRHTHIFINREDAGSQIDHLFVPFAYVYQGMKVVDELGIGWAHEYNNKVRLHTLKKKGMEYIEEKFPKCTTLIKAEVIEEEELLEGVEIEEMPVFDKFGKEEYDEL